MSSSSRRRAATRAARARQADTDEPYSEARRHTAQDRNSGQLTVTSIEATHPQGFGGHEFEYRSEDDLFACVRCGGFEVALRDRSTGEIRPCKARVPDVFTADLDGDGGPVLSWTQLVDYLDQAEAHLDDDDPYARAAAHTSRARLYTQLATQTTIDVYKAACLRAALCDDITAARIRFPHGIPTLMPGTETELLGLHTCASCGRPWQVSQDGACERCPRIRFGPAPSTRADADKWAAALSRPAGDCPGCRHPKAEHTDGHCQVCFCSPDHA